MKDKLTSPIQETKENINNNTTSAVGSGNAFAATEQPQQEVAKEISDEDLDKLLSEAEETKD